MNRRQILKTLAVASAAAMVLPSCISDPKKVSIALNNLNVTGDDEELLALLAETIIPETETPGAKTVAAHLFTLVMVDDCLDAESKQKYLAGLKDFDTWCKAKSGKRFTDASAEERLALLRSIDGDAQPDENINVFYSKSKGYIIRGYLSSQYYLTDVRPYQLVPGPNFKGCVPVTSNPA